MRLNLIPEKCKQWISHPNCFLPCSLCLNPPLLWLLARSCSEPKSHDDRIFGYSHKLFNSPCSVLAQTAKTQGGTPRSPYVLGGKFHHSSKSLNFWEHASQRTTEKYAKDCWKFTGGWINTQRILEAKSLPPCSDLSLLVEKSLQRPVELESKLWKLALLIDVFEETRIAH